MNRWADDKKIIRQSNWWVLIRQCYLGEIIIAVHEYMKIIGSKWC
jgi:hypothetical protein